jgi:serine/threonine-protein kinase
MPTSDYPSPDARVDGGADSDRNLLFAVLALQADLIDRDRFVEVCTLWASRKDRPLAELLVEQGWLSDADRADVERLLARKLKRHQGDAHASLAEAAGEQARAALAGIRDADVEQSLAGLSTRLPAAEGSPVEPSGERAGRNWLYEEIGQGGMGIVLRGHDPGLGRDLAVKVLRAEHQGDAGLERRFVEEAQITGQLQHPGVVPIYELGRFAQGRPFFTMKLIKGRTLAQMLAGRPNPGHELPRSLGIFEQVAQALAYAHSHGVIHRDLKPANIMVGAFGEVQVMDWGLAKVLARHQPADPEETTAGSLIRTARSDSTGEGEGRTGVVGTPAFMAPEQARGEVDRVDERADVFGLGAILCVILSGKAPFAAGSSDEVLRRAMAGDLGEAFARLESCGAEAELVALARTCLAPRREDRPRHAGEVAARLSAYLAGVQERLRQAGLERAAAEARAEEEARTRRVAEAKAAVERRARRLTATLAALLLVLIVGGGSAAWLWQQQRQQAGAAATEAMSEARLRLADGRFSEALAAAVRARDLAQTAGAAPAVREEAEELANAIEQEEAAARRDRRLLAALLEVRRPREGPQYRTDDKGLLVQLAEPSADEQFAAAFRDWQPSFDVDALGTAEAAARLKSRPPAVRAEVIAALDEWASERRRQKMPRSKWRRPADLAAVLDDWANSRQGELRQLLAGGTLPQEQAVAALATALRPVPVPFDAGLGPDRQRLRRLVEKTDAAKEPVLGLLTLTRALRAAGDDLLAEGLLAAAVRARPHEVVLQHALGEGRAVLRRWREAVECYAAARALRPELGVDLATALVHGGRVDEGLALFERLTARQPNNPWLRLVHGNALFAQRRHEEAEAAYRQAIRLKPDYAEAHYNLGVILNGQGRHKEAEAAYRQAIRLKPDDHDAHANLGIALNGQGRHKEAVAACQAAVRLKPDDPNAHNNLGAVLNDQGSYKEAEAACRAAIRLKPDLPQAHNNLGAALGRQGRHKEAEAACRTAIRLKPDHHLAHHHLGVLLNRQGRHKEAEAACRTAIRLKPDYSDSHYNLGNALNGQGRYKEAEAACRTAIRLKPNHPEAHNNLGAVLGRQGRDKEAEAAYRTAIRLKPDLHQAYNNLGNALSDQGRQKEAEVAYREAIRVKPDSPEAHYSLGIALGGQGRYKEAEEAYRQTIRLKPDYAEAHCNLGHALRNQGRFSEALVSLRRGHALGSARHGWRYPSAAWVRHCQRLLELDPLLAAVLSGAAEPGSAVERLELASLCQLPCKGLHATAARFAADAFASDARLAHDLQQQHRYNAACSAALAAAGQAEDARFLPDRVVVKLRRQAQSWLLADLAVYARLAQRDEGKLREVVQQRLLHWRADPNLASVRDETALSRLDSDERQQWWRLWQDVAGLLRQLAKKE